MHKDQLKRPLDNWRLPRGVQSCLIDGPPPHVGRRMHERDVTLSSDELSHILALFYLS